ncbi:PKD domain-containing protein [Arthrobacter sp. 49Tsu3.1M3]|uniref:PKD domain-containing protein n=1 Tax=Arthrobacter sp. 49Tsu3.1M3 TaxID=1279029 RepID=UPI0011784DDB|nr:LamG-like jellyroll fold domain-containing protein [Arthrobacter sp. 49Tsu3.1M3]
MTLRFVLQVGRRVFVFGVSLAMLLAVAVLPAPAATADTAPVDPASPATPVTVSADALPTVQIDGVAWQQVVVGNTVYVVGKFTTARPAGSAPGTNTVARNNILAYDIRTGVLIPGFAPSLNAQALSVAASPDGSRIYIGGDFTAVNGATVWRVAALNATTGQLITSFLPKVASSVRAIVATDTAVYFGGLFGGVGSVSRQNLAAASPADGSLLPWRPAAAGGKVNALAVSPDKTRVVIGGAFTTLNGSSNPGYGLGAVDAANGDLRPFGANNLIRNGGTQAAILSLASDSTNVYGSGYVFGSGGNLEGVFSANWSDGSIKWVDDCHGDTYGVYPAATAVYAAGHSHYCGNIGGFPQTDPWGFHRGLAFSKAATGTVTDDPYGYFNFAGNPAPSLLNWFPDLDTGTATGQNQGPWAVTGNSQYVVMGGEFRNVNSSAQQGLVRFAVKEVAPNKEGPRVTGSRLNPSVISTAAGTARISWQADWDRDNEHLTYQVIRDGKTTTPIYTTAQDSTFWKRPSMGYIDSGLAPGSTHTYRVFASDPFGNVAKSDSVTVTVSASGTVSDYANKVLADGALDYWRLDQATGMNVVDWAGWNDLTAGTGISGGATGAILQDSDKASNFDGTGAGFASTQSAVPGPDTFTLESWINTTSTSGGKILGFGSNATGDSGSYDRHVYMDNAGHVWFGVYTGDTRTLSSSGTYNDGQWHQIVASLGSTGMALYIDGKRVGTRSDVTSGQQYSGFWRVGGDNLGGWPSGPASNYFQGSIDDVSLYPGLLTLQQVQSHFTASGRTLDLPLAPADAYGKAVFEAAPDLYWRLGESSGSTATDSGAVGNPGTYVTGVTLGAAGALAGTANTAARFDGSSGLLSSNAQFSNPTTYSEELWFNTTTTNGGKLIGFGNQPTGLSSGYDRHVYMEQDGRLTFGVWTGNPNTITSPNSYNDGSWHHMVATQAAGGMKLYVDGTLIGTNPQNQAQVYDGYWRVGSDNTWGPQPYFSGLIDEVAVYPTELAADVVARHFSLGDGGTPNQPPAGAFTSSSADLVASFDGSGSTDPDGTVAAYAWDFGDGTAAGTGATPFHAYAAAGTYQVKLTVTDDKGSTGSVTKPVTVTAANQPPAAAFTSSAADLVASFDGSGSSDPDGTVAAYAWDFGDGTAAGSGAKPAHTYAAAGTYQVKLTVTDDKGATASVTQAVSVTAAASPVLAQDGFGRSLVTGWGSADQGGPWTLNGSASYFSVANGVGNVTLSKPGAGPSAYLSTVSSAAAESAVKLSLNKVASGGGAFVSVVGRRVGTAGEYAAKVKIAANGAVTLDATRLVGGASSTLVSTAIAGLAYTVGDQLQVRLQVTGTSPTLIRAKVWKVGAAEPANWQISATDSDAALQAPGSAGLVTYVSGTAMNTPIIVRFDDYAVTKLG